MRFSLSSLAITAGLAAAPFAALAGDPAAGEAAAGEAAFNQCQACHVVRDDAGEVLAGRNARQGPNLYGVVGRQAGTLEGFRYGNSMVEAGEKGLVWDEESMVAYLANPNGFLRDYLDNPRARGNMAFQVRNADQARDLYAFLATFSPADEDAEGTEGEDEDAAD